jgi:hypothetical protein
MQLLCVIPDGAHYSKIVETRSAISAPSQLRTNESFALISAEW